jgi:hypothetical protein
VNSFDTDHHHLIDNTAFLDNELKAELKMKSKREEEEDDTKFCSLKVSMDHEDKDSKTYVVKIKR